jgi:hypothetical protein
MEIQSKTKFILLMHFVKVNEMQCPNASLDPILAA